MILLFYLKTWTSYSPHRRDRKDYEGRVRWHETWEDVRKCLEEDKGRKPKSWTCLSSPLCRSLAVFIYIYGNLLRNTNPHRHSHVRAHTCSLSSMLAVTPSLPSSLPLVTHSQSRADAVGVWQSRDGARALKMIQTAFLTLVNTPGSL